MKYEQKGGCDEQGGMPMPFAVGRWSGWEEEEEG